MNVSFIQKCLTRVLYLLQYRQLKYNRKYTSNKNLKYDILKPKSLNN